MSDQDLLEELRIAPEEREPGGWRRRTWLLLVAGALVVLAGWGYFALVGKALAVDTAVAESPSAAGSREAVLEATGYVTARREATVSFKIPGKLEQVLIEEGERVEAGQVIARLDDSDAGAQLQLAQARLLAAQAQLGQIQVKRDQAERDLKRQRELRNKRLASEEALENAGTQLDALSAQLEAQRSQVDVAEAEVQVAQVGYDNTILRAPFSGVVVAKTAQPGEIVSPSSAGGGYTRTGIGTIVDMASLEIEVDVNEAYINRVKPGQPVQAVLDAYPDWKIPAAVIAIIPTADRSKATVKVRIAIKEKDPRILPDMGVRVSFLESRPSKEKDALTGVLVPGSAVVERDGKPAVFVVEGDRARRRAVTLGQSLGDRRLVQEGLRPGERVVRDPPSGLADGMRIAARAPGA
jgi:RND family efflux transporter MFP subunit